MNDMGDEAIFLRAKLVLPPRESIQHGKGRWVEYDAWFERNRAAYEAELHARAELLAFAAEEFDYALMVTTIYFVDDLGTAFREAARVLKPGGNLIVGFIDRDSPLGKAVRSA